MHWAAGRGEGFGARSGFGSVERAAFDPAFGVLHRLVARGGILLVAAASSFDVGDVDVGISVDRTGNQAGRGWPYLVRRLRRDPGDRWILVWVGRACHE